MTETPLDKKKRTGAVWIGKEESILDQFFFKEKDVEEHVQGFLKKLKEKLYEDTVMESFYRDCVIEEIDKLAKEHFGSLVKEDLK